MHSIKSRAYTSVGVLMAPHLAHLYSTPTAMQHPGGGMLTSRVTKGEDLLYLERLHNWAI